MKYLIFVALLLLGCNTKSPSISSDNKAGVYSDNAGLARAGNAEIYRPQKAIEGEQAPTWTSFPEDIIQEGCNQFRDAEPTP